MVVLLVSWCVVFCGFVIGVWLYLLLILVWLLDTCVFLLLLVLRWFACVCRVDLIDLFDCLICAAFCIWLVIGDTFGCCNNIGCYR